ncbi:CLIP-associating protein 1 isoform X2 [Biomphalaria glabrata]|nr:CLIP-associating protein 1-like isoform X2 [Biomphalaria glabrata]KAI8767147.1 CLIP-associating protein 1 isoform X2 [Biomphalaria glabrata]
MMDTIREELYKQTTEVPLTPKVLQHLTVSLNGLEVLCLMVDRMGENFKPHVTTVLPAVIDRLGDSKDQVRDMAQQLLLKLMMPASTPQYVFDRLGPAFSHKLWHVKEGILLTLQNTINRYGARCLLLSKIVPDICKLLDDPSPQVREAATNALVEIYRHVGEKVRHDLKKIGLSQQRMNVLNSKFEELKLSGNMLPTADVDPLVSVYMTCFTPSPSNRVAWKSWFNLSCTDFCSDYLLYGLVVIDGFTEPVGALELRFQHSVNSQKKRFELDHNMLGALV